MRLATIRTEQGTRAVRVDDDAAVELGPAELGEFLARPDWRAAAAAVDGARHPREGLDFAPPVPRPEKVICVGMNYRKHILEMGRELPEYPTLFAKFARTLVGAYDPITLPAASAEVDWEAELGLVIGTPVRHADDAAARAAIAGYTVVNDISARDFQNRTPQWLQGKVFESSTPVGPWIEVAQPGDPLPTGEVSCVVDGERMQESDATELVFDPVTLVGYISGLITLVPGDLISTGTPGGVGAARTPPRWLGPGSVVVTRVEGVGELRNTCRAE